MPNHRNLFEYRKVVALPTVELDVDDAALGFEATAIADWQTYASGGGSLTVTTSRVKHGLNALRIYAPNISDYAFVWRALPIAASGIIKFIGWVNVADYIGTTSSDYQVLGVYTAIGDLYPAAFVIGATGITLIHQGVNVLYSATPLSKDEWHKLAAEIDYSAKTITFFIDDIQIAQYTETSISAIQRVYVGDIGSSVGRGDFYWDSIYCGRKVT